MATGLPARRMVIVCALLASATAAFAERRPVAVISLSAEQDATALADDLYNALVNHPELELRPLPQSEFVSGLKGPFADEDAAAIEAAARAKAEADVALKPAQREFVRAQEAAERGMTRLRDALPTPAMLGLYSDLAFDLGLAYLGQKKPADASLAFALAHRLDRTKAPDPIRYVPEIIDAFNAAASRPEVPAKLEVKGEGRVWIDGVDVGPAPSTFDTTEGLHVVQLTGPDRDPRGDQVLVPQETSRSIAPAPATDEARVKRARIALRDAPDLVTRASAIKRLAELLDVGDAVIITKPATPGGKLSVQTWRDHAPGFSAVREHATEQPIDLLAPLAPPRKPDPPRVDPDPVLPPIVVEKKWHQKTWVRASFVTGIAAFVVGAVLYARRDKMIDINTEIKQD